MKRLSSILFACALATTLFAAHPVGTLTRDTILGVPCRVYLPSSYAQHVKAGSAVFPCLYLQHGMYGCEDDWANHNLIPIMDSLLKEEVIVEMVIIMPDNFLGSIPPAERKKLMEAPNVTPDGNPFAENRIGRTPEVATRNMTGCPGRTPQMSAPLMDGSAFSGGVRIPSCRVRSGSFTTSIVAPLS